jgi:hypothetical protein
LEGFVSLRAKAAATAGNTVIRAYRIAPRNCPEHRPGGPLIFNVFAALRVHP